MIELVGDELYQWDVGRKVKITPKRGYTISCVHFNDGSDDSLTMVNGVATARIPDELLQQCGSVTVYAVSTKEGGIETTESRQFYIKKKTKPTGYTHVPTEVATINSAITAATQAQASAKEAEGYKTTAQTYASNARDSAKNASTSETTAKTYATNASNSAKNASTSETNAKTYATNASNSAKNASTSETNAKTYATNASNSAVSASTSANSANAYKVAAENAKNEILGNGGTYSDPKDESALKEIRDSRDAIRSIESNMNTAVEAAGQIDSFRSEITTYRTETKNARDDILSGGADGEKSVYEKIIDAETSIIGSGGTVADPKEGSALRATKDAQKAAEDAAQEAKEAATNANQGIKVVDALDNTSKVNALSANQGRVLNEKIANLNEIYIMKSGETEADVPKSVEVIIMPEESGTPYILTDSDKSEIASLVKEEVPLVKSAEQPIFANSIDECTDTTKLYVLPDGQIYAYMMYEGINYSYDNLLTSDKWLPEKRVSSTGEIKTDGAEGMVAVGDIPCKAGDLVRIKNFDLTINVHGRLAFVDSNDSAILTLYTAQNYDGSNIGFFKDQISETDGVQSFVVGVDGTGTQISKASAITAIRFSQVSKRVGNMEDVIVTVNQEITEPTVVKEYRWSDTGHAFVSANYEDRIVELEESVSGLQRDVSEFRENVNNLEAISVPSYYDDIIADKTNEVKSLQSIGGNDCVSFVWASDTHIPDNSGGRTNDIGKVMAKILNNCQIPFAVISGDVGTQASHTTEDALLESQKSIPEHLAPLWDTDRLLVSLGNHDGAWGDSSGYYRHQLTPQRMFQLYFSGQALDFRRVFSDDGLYFYVDDVSHKARYIVLNSQFAGEYAEDSNGWAVNNRFGTSCYGQSQLEWFANVALDMPGGYGAIVVTHVPLNIDYTVDRSQLIGIINAHCNKTTFHGEITDGVDGWSNSTIDVNYQNATGEIIAVFTGHIHKDTIDTTTLACPMISITTAGGDVRDTDASARTSGTDSETAFDIVTINRTTKRINCTRVGAGQNREIEYTSYASSQEPNKSDGKSAYQIALDNGFVGSQSEWLASLKGDKGDKGDTPVKGTDYFTEDDKTEIVNSVLNALPTWQGGEY